MRQYLQFVCLWLALSGVFGSAVSQGREICPSLAASDAAQRANLMDYICYLAVSTEASSPQTIDPASLPDTGTWQAANGKKLAFPQSDSVYWLRLNIHNPSESSGFWYLKLNYAPLDRVTFLVESAQGTRIVDTGDHTPFNTRGIDYRYYLLPVTLEEGEHARISLRLQSEGALNVPISLQTPDELVAYSNNLTLTHGLFYGSILIFAIFNLLLFVSSRTAYYFYNAFYMASLGLFLFAMGGFAYQYLWPDSPLLANLVIPLAIGLCALSINLFGRSFLEVDAERPLTSKLLTGQTLCSLGLLLMVFYWPYTVAIKVLALFTLLVICNLFFIGVIRWRQGHNHAKWYVLSWSMMVLGTLSYALAAFGYMPDFLTHEIVMQGAIGGQVVLLNYAMVQRWRQLQLKLLEVEHNAKQQLELQVSERTAQLRDTMRDLERANRQLEELSTQDGLTGLRNRRYLDRKLTDLVREARRTAKPVALALFDADHFKRINDRYGHAFGDSCLQAIGQVLERNVRRPRDVVARFGGEEFALLLPDTDAVGAVNVSQGILEQMAATPVPTNDGTEIRLTLSAGVAIQSADEPETSLFQRADQALYKAKASGRNRVVLAAPLPTTEQPNF